MKKQRNKQTKLKMDKGIAVSEQISWILWFAGACLIVLFVFAFLVLKHLI